MLKIVYIEDEVIDLFILSRHGTNTNTNANTQIRKYKYKYTNTNRNTHMQIQIQIQGGHRSQILTFGKKTKDFTKTAISLEPLDRHRFNTPQIEALGVPDKKNTSGGL